MVVKKRLMRGRPPGPHAGGYKPPYMRKQQVSIRLPAWILLKIEGGLGGKAPNLSQYVQDLILKDTGWKPLKNDRKV